MNRINIAPDQPTFPPQSFFLPTPPQYVPFPFYPRRARANKDN